MIIDGARALQRVRDNVAQATLLISNSRQQLDELIVSTTRMARLEMDTRMDKSMIKGIAVGGITMVVLGAGAVTSYKSMVKPEFAEVVAVNEIVETVVTPHERCEDAQVQHQTPVKDEHRVAGTVVGGLAGGLLGSTVGGGKGKTLATVAGAAAGGFAGNQVQKNMQEKDVVTTTEHRCKTVNEKSHKVVGYNVTYRMNGKDGVVRTSFKPGPKLPVRDGQVVTTPESENRS
ncbi:MAG TPA: glycine zipper 2TM domain-containing protein [Steroidobacteraceae bacterium]|jgi:uncharacterized protein YcfJ|nr:glycine zipper 2TM domain-containing protein [Steroidobacteraceae bacterium]